MFSGCRLLLVIGFVAMSWPASVSGDDWPAWRGKNRDGISTETGLLKQWPEKVGPTLVWNNDNAGVGYSSLAVASGVVVTQGDLNGVEHIIAFDADDGSILWAVQPKPVEEALEKQIDESFSRFDKNADGTLDVLESLAALGNNVDKADEPAISGDAVAIAKTRAGVLFMAYDKNQDGVLEFEELPPQLQGQIDRFDSRDDKTDAEQLAKTRVLAAFKLDANSDGQLDRKEAGRGYLGRIFGRADQNDPQTKKRDNLLTTEELQAYFQTRERGRDGRITSSELATYFSRSATGRDGVLVKSDLKRFYGGYRNSYGDGPRGTPTISDGRVYAEGGSGDLTCVDLQTGRTIWHVNLAKDLKGGRPGWGYSESPLVIEDWVIVTPGGRDGTVAALNKTDGSVVWRSEVKQSAHYASPQVATIAGVRQVVQFSRESVFGVAYADGKMLWSYSNANNGTANVATPIIFNDHVLASSGYGKGSGLVKVSTSDDTQKSEEIYFQKRLSNHHGGLVKIGDYVYGFGSGLMCMNAMTGDIKWQARSVGKGSLVFADGMLYCLGEGHEVALVEATPEEYRERGRFKIERHGRPAWAHPVVANGRLFIRNMQSLAAYNVSSK